MDMAVGKFRPAPFKTASKRSIEVDIVQQGYSLIEIDPSFLRPRLAAVRHGMQRITDDPKLAALFPYRVYQEDAYGSDYSKDVGLIRRDDDEHKWFFHHTPGAYPPHSLPVHRHSEYGSFFAALRDLNAKAMEITIFVAERFDTRNHEKSTIYKYSGSMAEIVRAGDCIDRVLRYLVRPGTARVDAKPHIDRGIFTVDWGATHGGLKILRHCDRTWVDADITESGLVAVFPGRKFGAVTDPERSMLGFGTPHGVRYERVDNRDRYAVVSFVHPATRPEHARLLRANHGWLREYEASLKIS